MALRAGNNAVLILTDGGGARTLSSYVKSLSFDLKGHGLVDVTCMGDSGHTWASDELEDCSFTVEFVYDDGANTVWDTLADATNGLRTSTVARAFEIGPAGSTSTYPKLSGNCWLESFTVPVAVGDMITVSATFKVDGAVTVGEYPA